jgi:hypothetical protein
MRPVFACHLKCYVPEAVRSQWLGCAALLAMTVIASPSWRTKGDFSQSRQIEAATEKKETANSNKE